jgi:Holliday junction DNA helicase RuvA
MIASVAGRLAAQHGSRVVIETAGGVGYEVTLPLGVLQRLPPPGETVHLLTELVVREDGSVLYGFVDELERRFFRRLVAVSGVGPRLAIAVLSALGVERAARAVRERDIPLLASVSGIGKKTAERLALELTDKVDEFVDAADPRQGGPTAVALRALEGLGYPTHEADRALREVLAGNGSGGGDTETLVRSALERLRSG